MNCCTIFHNSCTILIPSTAHKGSNSYTSLPILVTFWGFVCVFAYLFFYSSHYNGFEIEEWIVSYRECIRHFREKEEYV